MFMCSRKTAAALLGVACVAALIYSQALAGKPVKRPGGGGGGAGAPTGTIYFRDQDRGFSGPTIIGMNPDGSGRFQALPEGIYGQPSSGTYGADGHRWWLTTTNGTLDSPVAPGGPPHRELFAIRSDSEDPTDPELLTWVQIVRDDRDNADEAVDIDTGSVRWSNDGLDSYVSFRGHDYRDETDNIYRLWLPAPAEDEDLFPSDFQPYGLDDLEVEVVLTIPRDRDEAGHLIKTLYNFTWSPLGDELAFFVGDSQAPLKYSLYVKAVSSDSDAQDLGTPVWEGDSTSGFLDWSPDGSRIVFAGRTTVPPAKFHIFAIWTVTPDGLEARAVRYFKSSVANGESYQHARWSPDGRYIVMMVVEGGSLPPWEHYIGISPIDKWHLTRLPTDLDPAAVRAPVAWVP